MGAGSYWSVEDCGWEPGPATAEAHWSVQRCRWEPAGRVTDALATPWSMFAGAPAVPAQRAPAAAPVEA